MDLTVLFKASVKTIKTTRKNMGIQEIKQNPLKNHVREPLLIKPKQIVRQISKLQDILIENKAAYLNVINYLSTNKTMNEIDREEIDNVAHTIITSCSSLIKDYKSEIKATKLSSAQGVEHYENISNSVEGYLKQVSKVYTEAKAIRVKRVIDTHKLSKLETPMLDRRKISSVDDFSPKSEMKRQDMHIENELSVEEMQMFESENELLYNELNSISDEVRQMETKVVKIAELQDLFTEKVLQQEKDIDRIANTVAATTDNIVDANAQIRQAIQRNAGLRVYLLFFFIVMSFSLLFLDWYND